jgi:hypothetical protein
MIQEVVFGVCSYDVLLDLTKQGETLLSLRGTHLSSIDHPSQKRREAVNQTA